MFDIIVRLIMGFALIWMGLKLFLGPQDYKAFAGNLKGPSIIRLLVRFPDWVIQGLGILLTLTGVYFLARSIAAWHPR